MTPTPSQEIDGSIFLFTARHLRWTVLFSRSVYHSPKPELLRESPVPGQKVHECMTPVVLWAKREGDGVTFFADIPDESPTIQAVASILIQGLDGLTPDEIASTPDHFPEIIFAGSPGARAFGMRGVLHQMQRLAQTV